MSAKIFFIVALSFCLSSIISAQQKIQDTFCGYDIIPYYESYHIKECIVPDSVYQKYINYTFKGESTFSYIDSMFLAMQRHHSSDH